MDVKAFIITLPTAVDRRAQVERIKTLCPLACEVIDAVDGRAMSENDRQKYVGSHLFRPHYPFSLRAGEVGHFLSQRKAWQRIIDQQLDAALLLEDDIELDTRVFNSGLRLAISRLDDVDIVKFRAPTRGRSDMHRGLSPLVHRPALAPLGTTSLLVTRGAAERLLSLTHTFDRPTDAFLQLSWVTGIHPRIIIPAGVEEISHRLGGSSIQSKHRPIQETIYRNIARPIYRAKVNGLAHWTELKRLYNLRRAAA